MLLSAVLKSRDAPILCRSPEKDWLSLRQCDKLNSLPRHMNTLLPKLKKLAICDCPEIELFPDGGLLPNLESLEIIHWEKLLSCLSSMGVLEGHTHLRIGGLCESVKSFPKQGLLPHIPPLKRLELFGFSSLETLDCKELLHLTSLERLTILAVTELKNMTGEWLPASLIELKICGTSLLEERCKMKDPQIWPKISHIRDIIVNFNSIQGDQND